MNITKENIDAVNAILKISIELQWLQKKSLGSRFQEKGVINSEAIHKSYGSYRKKKKHQIL